MGVNNNAQMFDRSYSKSYRHNDFVATTDLFEVNLALRIKRSKAYYALVERMARIQKAIYLSFMVLFLACVAAHAYFNIFKFLGLELDSNLSITLMLITALPIALIAGLISIILVGYVQKYNNIGKAAARNNLLDVISQNNEMLTAFYNEFLREQQVLYGLGFDVGVDVKPLDLEIKPSSAHKVFDNNGLTMVSTVSDGTKVAELSVDLEFGAYYSVLKAVKYTVKK